MTIQRESTMSKKPSLDELFSNWQRQFAVDAVSDDCAEIRRHIEYLELDCSPAAMLEGTELLIAAVLAYCQMDNKDCESFITQQRYWLRGEGLPHYCLTFNLAKGHFGRVLTDRSISNVDFADLFNHPWYPYKTAGFHEVYISRLDGEPLEKGELETLDRRFTEDIYYDNEEDEISAYVNATEFEDTALATAVENGH